MRTFTISKQFLKENEFTPEEISEIAAKISWETRFDTADLYSPGEEETPLYWGESPC